MALLKAHGVLPITHVLLIAVQVRVVY